MVLEPDCGSVGTARRLGHHGLLRGEFGQPEIQHLGLAAVGDEDVGGFDVAMHNAARVRGVERIADLDAPLQGLRDLQRMPFDAVLQGRPLQALHHNEVPALVFPDIVDGADAGMVQSGGGARFPAEALQRRSVGRELGRQELDGHKAAQLGVLGLVDHTHPAPAELFQDAVMRNGFAGHEARLG